MDQTILSIDCRLATRRLIRSVNPSYLKAKKSVKRISSCSTAREHCRVALWSTGCILSLWPAIQILVAWYTQIIASIKRDSSRIALFHLASWTLLDMLSSSTGLYLVEASGNEGEHRIESKLESNVAGNIERATSACFDPICLLAEESMPGCLDESDHLPWNEKRPFQRSLSAAAWSVAQTKREIIHEIYLAPMRPIYWANSIEQQQVAALRLDNHQVAQWISRRHHRCSGGENFNFEAPS